MAALLERAGDTARESGEEPRGRDAGLFGFPADGGSPSAAASMGFGGCSVFPSVGTSRVEHRGHLWWHSR